MSYKKLYTPIEPVQSAVIPYRITEGKPEVLLITTRNKGRWIIPKGWIEDDLSSHMSAQKEALEEAGVKGAISSVSLGCYRHGSAKKSPIVEVFLMRVKRELDTWPERAERTRQWVSLDDAYEHVSEAGLKSILDEAAAIIRLSMAGAASPGPDVTHPAIPKRTGSAN